MPERCHHIFSYPNDFYGVNESLQAHLPCGTVLKDHDFHLFTRLPGNILNYYIELSYILVKLLFATIMPFDAT
jgi:hypothetical protein